MKGTDVNIKLIIENRESGTGYWLLVPYFNKREGYFKTVDREQRIGNRKPRTSSLFLILVYNVSKVQIGNKEQVPCSFVTLNGFILVSGFVYFISM